MATTDKDSKVLVNGVLMSVKEYKSMMREKLGIKAETKKNTKKAITEIQLLSEDITNMYNKLKLMKSLTAYYDNAYRQWGTIANNILQHGRIQPYFVKYRCKIREINETLSSLETASKRNSKMVFHYMEKLSYQLDDIRDIINNLCFGISKSGVMEQYKDHECINGCDRRLGLKIIMSRSWGAIKDLNKLIMECNTNCGFNNTNQINKTQRIIDKIMK
jgi:hypothetical protein